MNGAAFSFIYLGSVCPIQWVNPYKFSIIINGKYFNLEISIMKNMCKKNTLGKILILVVAAWHLVILMRLIRWCEIEHQDWKIHALLAVSYLQKKRVPIHCYICQFSHEKAKSWEIQSSLYVSSANACILFPCILQVDNREMLQKYSWTKKKKENHTQFIKKKHKS